MARKGGTPENLIPAKKGEIRNPKGRTPVLPELKEVLLKILAKEEKGTTALEKVLNALYKRALKGDVRAVQEILDRNFGKVPQPTENIHRIGLFDEADKAKINQALEKLKDAIQPE